MHIVIAGGTGFLGSALAGRLREEGHAITVLTRHPRRPDEVAWNPDAHAAAADTPAWTKAVADADAIVNLAGAPIAAGRWTAARKVEIRTSRVHATRALVEAIARAPRAPRALLNASAIGIYGPRSDEPVTEATPPGSDFLASVGIEWEEAARPAASTTRLVLLRTGLVLDRTAGALPQVALPFAFFAGGPLGSGRQYMSWIHVDDWVAMVRWALATDTVSGPLNVTAPTPVTNREFARTLGRVLHRPAVMPAPAFALRVVLGEMADAVLTGQRVLPAKAQSLGFAFRYPELEPALRAIYGAR